MSSNVLSFWILISLMNCFFFWWPASWVPPVGVEVRSGLPGGALRVRSHLASWHLGFSVGCGGSGFSSPPCKGRWFLGSACVLVSTAAGDAELHPRPDCILGGEMWLCSGGEVGWGKCSSSPQCLSVPLLYFDPPGLARHVATCPTAALEEASSQDLCSIYSAFHWLHA